MAPLDVADLESRVRRRLAVTQRLAEPAGDGPAKSGKPSSERRLPSDGGPPLPKAAVDVRVIARACDGIALFWTLHRDDRTRLYESMYQLEFRPGEPIVRQGEEGRNFYVVVDGYLTVTVAKPPPRGKDVQTSYQAVNTLSPGDTFGEVALLHSVPRSATVSAANCRAKVWALDRSTFKRILSEAAFRRREAHEALLKRVKLLEDLDDYGRKILADALVPCQFIEGEAIFRQGCRDEATKFHIVERGVVSVRLSGGQEVNRLRAGQYFGEISVLTGSAPTATLVALTDVRTVSLDRAAFRRMLGDDVLSAMTEYASAYAYDEDPSAEVQGVGRVEDKTEAKAKLKRSYLSGVMRRVRDPTGARGRAAAAMRAGARAEADAAAFMTWADEDGRSTVGAGDVTLHKELGVGMSGRVYLGKVTRTNAHCCVKVMQKKKVLRLDQAENIMRERELMRSFDTPFVMQSRCSFQDDDHLYLVMDFMPGGDLFQFLVNGTERGSFPPAAARFYAAEVLLALEYLHARGFVYRDLKPENVLLDGEGHVKLADLGFCKPLEEGERTYTTCGTSDYMAPEVMLSQGYGRSADYWAFGVFLYELLAGAAPFHAKTDSARHRRILTADLKFRADFHLHAKDLVSKLCVVDLSHRLGMQLRGIDDVKDHAFWIDDWDAVARRETKPPVKPEMRRAEVLTRLEPLRGVTTTVEMDRVTPEEDAVFAGYY